MEIILTLLVCLLIAAAISGGIMLLVRSKLKSVRSERTACNYTRRNSFKTTNSRDNFLFNNIVRVPIPRNNSKK
ncbi:MAG: hypothetical protein FWB96_03375 [Defluviitaleaceae bacterium]|nr:hypothetical protein [Defluviitaleaceae bacterium]MCL2261720.1 hypothetical protein [Defluviitaleaceae bacterium]